MLCRCRRPREKDDDNDDYDVLTFSMRSSFNSTLADGLFESVCCTNLVPGTIDVIQHDARFSPHNENGGSGNFSSRYFHRLRIARRLHSPSPLSTKTAWKTAGGFVRVMCCALGVRKYS